MKHVIEPTFASTTPPRSPTRRSRRAHRRLRLRRRRRDAAHLRPDQPSLLRARPVDGQRGQTREFLTVGVQQTYYTNPSRACSTRTTSSYSGRPKAVDLSPIALTARFSPPLAFDANARARVRRVRQRPADLLRRAAPSTALRTSGNVSYSRQRPSPASTVSSYIPGRRRVRFTEGTVTRHLRAQLGHRRAATSSARRHGVGLHGAVLRLPGRVSDVQLSPQLATSRLPRTAASTFVRPGGARHVLEFLRRRVRRRSGERREGTDSQRRQGHPPAAAHLHERQAARAGRQQAGAVLRHRSDGRSRHPRHRHRRRRHAGGDPRRGRRRLAVGACGSPTSSRMRRAGWRTRS